MQWYDLRILYSSILLHRVHPALFCTVAVYVKLRFDYYSPLFVTFICNSQYTYRPNWRSAIATTEQSAAAPTKTKISKTARHRTKRNQQANKTVNRTRGWIQHVTSIKNDPKAIGIGEQNRSFLKHKTCACEDGQLGRNMCELEYKIGEL
jgi:hypothetical protein